MNEKILVNETLSLCYPDGFHVMTDQEKQKFNYFGGKTGEGLVDSERHIVISLGHASAGALSAVILNAKDLAKGMEKKIRKPMQAYGYECKGFSKRTIAGEKAVGFGYEYTAKDVAMYAESYVVKRGKIFFYLHFYGRQSAKDESLEIWDKILDSAEWIQL